MGNGNEAAAAGTRMDEGLLTPHGERELEVMHNGHVASAELLTPHGERERGRSCGPRPWEASPNPSWGTGTAGRGQAGARTQGLLTPHGERERLSVYSRNEASPLS